MIESNPSTNQQQPQQPQLPFFSLRMAFFAEDIKSCVEKYTERGAIFEPAPRAINGIPHWLALNTPLSIIGKKIISERTPLKGGLVRYTLIDEDYNENSQVGDLQEKDILIWNELLVSGHFKILREKKKTIPPLQLTPSNSLRLRWAFVIRSPDIEAAKEYYSSCFPSSKKETESSSSSLQQIDQNEKIDVWIKERHGAGPWHYAMEDGCGNVFELYPCRKSVPEGEVETVINVPGQTAASRVCVEKGHEMVLIEFS